MINHMRVKYVIANCR